MARRGTRLEDIAELANVSVSTVSRALNDHPAISEDTKRLVWKLARERGYKFRPSMPTLVSGAAATIVIVIPRPQGRHGRISDPFYQELIVGVAEAARDSRCDLLFSHLAPGSFEDLSQLMAANRANGVIFLGQSELHERFNRLAKEEVRFLAWGADLPGQQYCTVGSDNEKGGMRAASHLIRLGRRRIAFFGSTAAPEAMQRYNGYLAAHAESSLEVDPRLIQPAHFEIESAETAVNQLIASGAPFDGIVAASDLIALGAIRALRRAGRSVPQDVSVVGYDNVLLASYSQPALTTISQDMAKAGRIMVSKLVEAISGNLLQSERLPTELIVRESCGA